MPESRRRASLARFMRSKPQAQPAGRLLAALASAEPVQRVNAKMRQPDAVETLPCSGLDQFIDAFNINIRPLPDFVAEHDGGGHALVTEISRGTGFTPSARRSPMRIPALSERLRAALLVPLDHLLPGVNSILEWPAALMPFQEIGVHALLERSRVLLADDMGLGKTVQAIAAIRILCQRRAIERTLLIVPASIVDQWRGELARWAPELRVVPIRGPAQERAWLWAAPAHVTMVSYETFRMDSFANSPSGPVRRHWDLVVLDEAQRIKNRTSEISRQVKTLRRRRSWAMTGTPLENKLDDLASILEFVDHTGDGSRRTYAPSQALLQRHGELQLRRRKSDVLKDLPPKQVIKLIVPLLPKQRIAYERAEREGLIQLREHGASIQISHVLELITRLKQLCNRDPLSGESTKLKDIRERLEILSDEGHRALVFSQYTDDQFGVAAAANYLRDANPLTFTGSLSNRERESTIRRFKEDDAHRALLLSLRAGGVGLNLQDASYVFHFDRWWNPAVERQAEDRSHRLGQRYPVTVFKYVCIDTIEERIEQILAEKQDLFDDIIDHTTIDAGGRLTRDDLFRVVGLDPPDGQSAPGSIATIEPNLIERCMAILEARGWTIAPIQNEADREHDFVATRTDEVGLSQVIRILVVNGDTDDQLTAILEWRRRLPLEVTTRPIIVTGSRLSDPASRIAREHHIAIWDNDALSRLEAQEM